LAWIKLLSLSAFGLMVCARMPQIILKGRFWAEEGSIFYRHAWNEPIWQAAWEPYGGYLNLVANCGSILARWSLPLQFAPYATISVGLFFQLLPSMFLITARDHWLRPWQARTASLLLVLLMPGSEEVWLQTLHCQFELALCCGIIVSLEARRGVAAGMALCVLVLAPLCGPASIALWPLFIARLFFERTPTRLLQCSAIGAGSVVQIFFFLSSPPGRAYALHPFINLSVISLKHFAIPFLGIHGAEAVNTSIRATFVSGHIPIIPTLLPPLILGPLALILLRRGLGYPGIWFFTAFLLTASICYFGAIGGGLALLDVLGNQRYVVLPQLLLELSILSLAATRHTRVALVSRVAVAWLLIVGLTNYWTVNPLVANGPAWRPEVAAWKANPNHLLQIWPDGWTTQLSRLP
jgi:hypothetical protein